MGAIFKVSSSSKGWTFATRVGMREQSMQERRASQPGCEGRDVRKLDQSDERIDLRDKRLKESARANDKTLS